MCAVEEQSNTGKMDQPTLKTDDSFSNLLEFSANNDVNAFKELIDHGSVIDGIGLWYGREKYSKQMVLQHKTPLMVAATYGSVDVARLLLSKSEMDVNFSCSPDRTTALHCASSGGSLHAVDVVNLLLSAGADSSLVDCNGHKPVDVIHVSPKLPSIRNSLQVLLSNDVPCPAPKLRVSIANSDPRSPVLSPPLENGFPSSPSDSVASPMSHFTTERKEYPFDPSLPDIKNSIYSTDEFRMFSFKIRPCSRAYSHDWTECPFVHPGENARRRDPRKIHYSCVPCPEFRKGSCRFGDSCEYAHGVFECWLHPAQYRTRLCKDGTSCMRRVCFFAHVAEELRPLYASTGSGIPSPRGASSMDMVMNNILPCSPSSMSASPLSPSVTASWSPQASVNNMPSLHLPGVNLQSSRLRSSLNARDMNDFEFHQELLRVSQNRRDELFSSEISSSPRKSAVLNQFQQQGVLSPINTTPMYSPQKMERSPFGVQSPRGIDPISPMGVSRFSSYAKLHNCVRGNQNSNLWSEWGLPSGNGEVDWSVNRDDLGQKVRDGNNSGEEPDLSWVQSLVKDGSPGNGNEGENQGECSNLNSEMESIDNSVLGAWLEQMQLDQLVA